MNKSDFKRFISKLPKVEFYKFVSSTEKVLKIGYKFDFIGYTFYIEDNQNITDSYGYNMGSLYKDMSLKQFKKNVVLYYEMYVEQMEQSIKLKEEETKNDVQQVQE